MKFIKTFLFILFSFLLFPFPLYAQNKKIIAEKDTCVNSAYPDSNFGTEKKISLGFTTSSKIMFLGFNLEGLSLENFANDEKAILNLWLEEATGDLKTIETEVLLPSLNWEEEKITWNNKPSLFSSQIKADLEATPGAKQIDITPLVKQWLSAEQENNGIAFYYNLEIFSRTYSSRENEKKAPILMIGKEKELKNLIAQTEKKIKKEDLKARAVKNKENVQGARVARSIFPLEKIINSQNILPGIMLWISTIFLLMIQIVKHKE